MTKKQESDPGDTVLPSVRIGAALPDMAFEVFQNDKDKAATFSDYKGKWLVVFFYPADFTFICPTELEELADHYEEIKKLDTEVLSFSTDTVFTHKAWHDTSKAVGKIEFPMGADPSGKISRAFGVYINESLTEFNEDEGLSLRGTFVIDPDGVVQAVEIHANNIGRSAKELIRKLQAAQFVRTHGGQVCPAEWNPGDDTLQPGMDLVGKI